MANIKNILTSKKAAIIISYISLGIHTLNNIILTPFYIKYLGLEQYGLYQMIYTIASYILILDFGIKTTMVRYISKFHVENDYESEKDFSAHCLILVSAISVAVLLVGSVINYFLLKIYPTITADESELAHQIFIAMLGIVLATLVERYLQGCVASYEHFVVFNVTSVLRLILKLVLTIVLLMNGTGVLAIVIVDLIAIIFSVVMLAFYTFGQLNFRIRLKKFKISLITDMFVFMIPVFLQSVISYINSYVDKTILGIMTTKSDVAVYSVAMTFVTLFNALPSAISSVFLPQANKLVYGNNCTGDTMTAFIIRPGRYQFMMCAGLIGGFLAFGKEFIFLWSGEDTVQAWFVALVIMIPTTIPLIENTIISILDAMSKRLFRSVVLIMISVLNVIVSIVLVSLYGMEGASIGTAIAFILGYGVILNIYYHKCIGINIVRMFKSIFSKTWICALIPILLSFPLNMIINNYSWLGFVVKCSVFIAVYIVLLFAFGFNKQEKNDINGMLKRFHIIRSNF